jgi:hypothetical protein
MVLQALPEKDVLYQTDRKTFRDFLQRFEAGCMKQPRIKERLKTSKADISKESPVILVFTVIIGMSAVWRETRLRVIESRSTIRSITKEAETRSQVTS